MYDIYTDTSANLLSEDIGKHDIKVIPLHYTVDGVESPSSAGFDGKAFYEAMRKGAVAKTSMINSAAFCEAFEQSLAAGKDVLYLGMSSGISGTYRASAAAAAELRQKYPDRKIAVIDTLAASLGEGLSVLYAAELKSTGMPFEDAVAGTKENSKSICQYFTVEDLMYLKRGGRITGAAAIVGNLLHIKPILTADGEGRIIQHSKVRGRQKALDMLFGQYQKFVCGQDRPVGIAHADSYEDAERLANRIRESGHRGRIMINCYEPVTGSHVGPGTVALFFYGARR